jgi:hypothetical protein
MPPKKSESKEAPRKGGLSKKAKKPEKGAGQLKLPVWAFFTHKVVEFNKLARDLSDRLHAKYGPEVTISQFEKLVAEFSSLSDMDKELVYLDKKALALLNDYRSAKDAKDTERRSFRSDLPIKDITAGLEACLSRVKDQPDSEESEESQDDNADP